MKTVLSYWFCLLLAFPQLALSLHVLLTDHLSGVQEDEHVVITSPKGSHLCTYDVFKLPSGYLPGRGYDPVSALYVEAQKTTFHTRLIIPDRFAKTFPRGPPVEAPGSKEKVQRSFNFIFKLHT